MILALTDDNFAQETANGIVLVDFYAVWCGPCRAMAPILEEIESHFRGKARVGKIDVDSEQQTAEAFQITSIPTIILFKNGKEIKRFVGLTDKEAIKATIASSI